MPRVLGYENRSTSFAMVRHTVECDRAIAEGRVQTGRALGLTCVMATPEIAREELVLVTEAA